MSENKFLRKTQSVNAQSQVLKLRDLVIGKPYKVLEMRHVNTKYGKSVLVDLEIGAVFLPQRYVYTPDEVNDANATRGLCLIYKGEKEIGKGHSMQMVDFEQRTDL